MSVVANNVITPPNGQHWLVRFCYSFLGGLLSVALWAIIGHMLFSRPGYEQFSGFLPGPAARALARLFLDSRFWLSAAASLSRVVVGLSVAFALGLPAGVLIGYYRRLSLTTDLSVQFLRMVSPLAWMPVALLIFKSFESAIDFLITMATIWPIILTTAAGVSRVNPQWINMARDQGARDRQVLTKIVVPACVPHILTSLRLALGVAWIVLVPAEFLGVSSGLGYLINDARDTMEYDRLMAVVIAIGILGFFLDGAVRLAMKRLKWYGDART
ncbi:MAG: ABC transporter permease [Deltaproteobacteria bacterium]|nr:ABC transporter permease [Deltaproteobacteria bacterium]